MSKDSCIVFLGYKGVYYVDLVHAYQNITDSDNATAVRDFILNCETKRQVYSSLTDASDAAVCLNSQHKTEYGILNIEMDDNASLNCDLIEPTLETLGAVYHSTALYPVGLAYPG